MPNGELCEIHGYADHLKEYNAIYIDRNLAIEKQPLLIIHEVIDCQIGKRVKHSRIDQIAIEIIDALQQLSFEIKKV